MLRTRRRKLAVVSAVAALALAGTALALWTVFADGPGRARTGTLAAPSVTILDTPGAVPADLFPSATPVGSIGYVVNNPNAYALTLTGIEQTGPTNNDASCNGSTLITVPTVTSLSIPVPPGTSNIVVPNVVRLDPSAPTTCQAINWDIPTKVTFSP